MQDVSIQGKITGSSEKVTVSNTAIGFTSAKIRPTSGNFEGMACICLFFVLEDDDIRFLLDGTDPTSSTGILMKKGQSLTLDNPDDIMRFKAIRVTGDAVFNAIYKFEGVT
jgi:hypothetical protein